MNVYISDEKACASGGKVSMTQIVLEKDKRGGVLQVNVNTWKIKE